MIARTLAAALLIAAPVALPATATAQALTPTETATIDRLVATALADTGVPSASIAIVRGGRVVLTKAYGKQSERGGAPNAAAPYQIASISKQFTAAALLLLEDDGKLSLDDTVAKYVPGITGGDRITLRQLLSHTAGLQDYWPQDYSFAAMAKPVTPQGIVDRWAKKPLDFAPGTQWQYSNTGYVVAGMVVEKVAGVPLIQFLQTRLFTPLGMTAKDQDATPAPGDPQGYGRNALGPVRPVVPAAPGWLFAAGELSMSAGDLAKWDIARMNRTTLPANDWAEQETAVKLTDGSDTSYGLGVSIGTADGHRFIEHSGEAVGFLSENIVYPDDEAAVGRIARGRTAIVVPPAAGATSAHDAAVLATVKTLVDQLRGGTVDRALLTDNASYYFTPVALADFGASLAPLGTPTAIVQVGRTSLRGGFEGRSFRASYPNRTLAISTFADPASGRIEQFLIRDAG